MGDEIIVHLGAIHFPHGATMHGQQVGLMTRKNLQQRIKLRHGGLLDADACLHRERHLRDGFPEGPQDAVDALRITQQTPACAFVENARCWAAEIEINACHRMFLQFFGGAHQMRHIIADHLQHHWTTRGILRGTAQDFFVQLRVGRDPEILGKADIRAAILMQQMDESMVGHILHRSQSQQGRVLPQLLAEAGRHGSFGGVWQSERWVGSPTPSHSPGREQLSHWQNASGIHRTG